MDLITSAPLWLQAPVVALAAAVLCGVLALIFLRIVDIVGAKTNRWFEGKNEK